MFDEDEGNAPLADELRRLLDASGFWSQPPDEAPCHPDQERLWLRASDGERAGEKVLPSAGDENARALCAFVAARVTWAPNDSGG